MIIPWFVLSFASALIIPVFIVSTWMKRATPPPQLIMWFPWIASGLAAVLCLAKDIVFSIWARKKLYSEFRDRAMQVLAPIRSTAPPRLPPAKEPPIIDAPGDAVPLPSDDSAGALDDSRSGIPSDASN